MTRAGRTSSKAESAWALSHWGGCVMRRRWHFLRFCVLLATTPTVVWFPVDSERATKLAELRSRRPVLKEFDSG
jgi:hypothetical protein